MIIGLDFDGVIAREVVVPKWLPDFLIHLILVFASEMANLEICRKLGRKHRLVIVSSRPVWCAFVTQLWLWLHRVPCVVLCCIGSKEDKSPVLLKEKVEVYFDDKQRYVEAANQQGISSYLFQNWEKTKEIISAVQKIGE